MYRGPERRRAARVPLSTSARAMFHGELVDCRLVNLSARGMLAIPERQVPVGSRLQLELTLPGSEDRLVLEAGVVRQGTVDGAYAVGIMFLNVPAPTERVLHEFVKTTRQTTRGVKAV